MFRQLESFTVSSYRVYHLSQLNLDDSLPVLVFIKILICPGYVKWIRNIRVIISLTRRHYYIPLVPLVSGTVSESRRPTQMRFM